MFKTLELEPVLDIVPFGVVKNNELKKISFSKKANDLVCSD